MLSSTGAIARADYLVGVQVYASGPNGQNAGAYSGNDYQFSTNSSTDQLALRRE
jgi:hypothetical protein